MTWNILPKGMSIATPESWYSLNLYVVLIFAGWVVVPLTGRHTKGKGHFSNIVFLLKCIYLRLKSVSGDGG